MSEVRKYPKRLIEVDLPIRKISEHARREKSIRHGHLSTLHMWWARRPLAACRAVTCAALWPDPMDEHCPTSFRNGVRAALIAFGNKARTERAVFELCTVGWPIWRDGSQTLLHLDEEASARALRDGLLAFLADFSNWDASTNRTFLECARTITEAAVTESSGGRLPIIDPFAGGGSFPLEAARIGADAVAFDLNPIPVLLNRILLEYLPRPSDLVGKLLSAAAHIRKDALARLGDLYGKDVGRSIAYLWARRVNCEGPGCGAAVPLVNSPWLAKKKGRYIWLEFSATPDKDNHIVWGISSASSTPNRLPLGTSKMGSVTCPACGFTTPKAAVYRQLLSKRGGASDASLLAVVLAGNSNSGREYRLPDQRDINVANLARERVSSAIPPSLRAPINPISPGKFGSGVASPTRIGCETFADLFAPRQMLALSVFAEEVSKLEDPVVRALLACAVDRLADYNSAHCRWTAAGEFIGDTFGRQAISIVWTYAECNPFSGASGDWDGAVQWIAKVAEHIGASRIRPGHAALASATALPLPDDSVAAVLTDPPYYGAIMYGDLSDFFYVWLRSTLGTHHPDLFGADMLVAKSHELIATTTSRGPNGEKKDAAFFEQRMTTALAEARRVVTPDGIGVIVFAHKSTAGWEAMLSAVVAAGWVVTASWPIDTERVGRTNAQGAAALGSSVHLVCRPRERVDGALAADVGDWRAVLEELPRRIHEWLPRLAEEGVVGADAIFACLGPALEVFSRYSRVEKVSGEKVELREYLEHVWAAVSREALSSLFRDADVAGLEPDARLTSMWLWTVRGPVAEEVGVEEDGSDQGADDEDDEHSAGALRPKAGFDLEFDAARKIAQGLGAKLDELGHVVEVKGDKARLLAVVERTRHLFGKGEGVTTAKKAAKKKQMTLFGELDQAAEAQGWGEVGAPKVGTTTLDRVHQAMILFGSGRGEALKRFLVEEGVGKQPQFWKLAQSLSALYPSGTDEKRWVDGVLARKKGLGF